MGPLLKRAALLAVVLGVLTLGGLSAWSRLSGGPGGLREGRLAPCPPKPNCVCSTAMDPQHAVEPIPYEGHWQDAVDRLVTILEATGNCEVVTADGGYVHAVFTTPVFRFLDDVEFLVDWEASVLHVRSASRVGYSDMGTNRERVERLRAAFVAGD